MKQFKKGEMSLFSVIFTLILVMLMFPIFEYLTTYEQSQAIRQKVQTDLNSLATSTNVNIFDNVKVGTLSAKKLEAEDYETQVGISLGLTKNITTWSSPSVNYSIRDLNVSVKNTGHVIVMFAQYTMKIPVKILGYSITSQEVTQTAESYIAKKYYSANQLHDKYIGGTYNQNEWQVKNCKITLTTEGEGTATSNKATCKSDALCTITAVPAAGRSFSGWKNDSGQIVSTDEVYSFYPTGDTSLTAEFVLEKPQAPSLSVLEAISEYDATRKESRLDNFKIKISAQAHSDSLTAKYHVVTYALTNWPYSTMSNDAKEAFMYGKNAEMVFTPAGVNVSSPNVYYPKIAMAADASHNKTFTLNGSDVFACSVSSRGYSYVVVAAYAESDHGNGPMSVKVFQTSGRYLVTVATYNNVTIPAGGIPDWLRSK